MNTSNTKIRVKRGFLIVSLLLCFSILLSAQTATLTIGSGTACANREVLIPVNASDILNLSAITLRIGFDTSKLQYIDLVNIDPQLTGINYGLNTSPPQIGIAWSSLVPANFQQGKFFDVKFLFREESCPVVFNTGCELADVNLQIIPVTFTNGMANLGNPVINLQPHDTTVLTGHSATFHVSSANATDYYWKESRDNGSSWITLQDWGNYSGTHTDQLKINQVPSSSNGYKYICTLSSGNCSTISTAVLLHVDSISSIFESANALSIQVHPYPNPFTQQINFEYTLPVAGYVTLAIYDCQGKWLKNIVSADQTPGKHTVGTDSFTLTPGFYIYKLNVRNEKIHLEVSGKITKQNP
jgi:hypothetical protein